MNREEYRTLYEYNDWANDRLMTMLDTAFGEETDLRQHPESRVVAIQETAVHILAAQVVWRMRWQGASPKAMLDPAEYPTPQAIRVAFEAERNRFWDFFAGLENDDALRREISFSTLAGDPYTQSLWQMMQHVITHGMYHRGQITGRLIDLGLEDVLLSTDLIAFYRGKK